MITAFYQKLALPEACFLGKRVYKKLFYENAALSAADKKAFSEDILDIQWCYTLKPETIAIARYEDNDREYHEIALMQVNLKNDQHSKRLAQIIQRAIPYPLLIVFTQGSRFALNVADKRINQADREKIRVDAFYDTDWLDLNDLSASEINFIDKTTNTIFKRIDVDYLGVAPEQITRRNNNHMDEEFGERDNKGEYIAIINEIKRQRGFPPLR